ncbi:MAG: porin [Candidatus Kentron sp. G]|nr:MAG: porin [Candidatus Kentron sp. G]
MSISNTAVVRFPDIGTRMLPFAFLAAMLPFSVQAYDVSDDWFIGVTTTGVVQQGEFSGTDIDDTGRATLVTDIGINYQPTDRDEFDLMASFAFGDSLSKVSPYATHTPYADDLADALEDINGRRDYLLTAWYRRTFALGEDISLALTGGIIDSTGYIDDNAFANDEVSQFMNDAFVNDTLMTPPSYDTGVVAELDIADNWLVENASWSLWSVWMNTKNVGGGLDGGDETYNYYAAQLGLHTQTGNYRLLAQYATDEFLDPEEEKTEDIMYFGFSADQEITDIIGVFARVSWQDNDAAIPHDTLYSGGFNINGGLWGRADDEIGIAYAHLDGGNTEIDQTDIMEGYVKFQLTKYTDLTLDIQYMDEEATDADEPYGFIYGIRASVYF